jgi:hypothetical protein
MDALADNPSSDCQNASSQCLKRSLWLTGAWFTPPLTMHRVLLLTTADGSYTRSFSDKAEVVDEKSQRWSSRHRCILESGQPAVDQS